MSNYICKLNENVERTHVRYGNRYGIALAGDLYTMKNMDKTEKYASIVVGAPYGGVKEQGPSVYANELAKRGFVVLTFDPCYMGESGGEPRHVSSPDMFSENISAGVDYLGLLPYVDRNKIAALGICGSGGFSLSAAAMDTRIKAVITASMFDMSVAASMGQTPEQIDPAVTARVPVFISEDCRYFQDACQGMPLNGYTPLFEAMLDHENIEVRTGVDARDVLRFEEGKIFFDNTEFTGDVVYTGPVDELFGCCFGRLPYRTLDFQFETYDRDVYQSHGTVNYTMDEAYTRVTEFKYLTGQNKPGVTTIMKEFSRAYTGAADEIPYYAIANEETAALYARYAAKAAAFPRLHLLGRLAEYRYYNMDAIVAGALKLSRELVK